MVDKENRRTCFKCGCSPAADGVKLFRFPMPSVKNLARCVSWARYIFPDRIPSLELQRSLHTEHRMLCQKHFKDEDFTDTSKVRLLRNTVPSDDENIPVNIDLTAGPSNRVPFVNVSNITSHQIVYTKENTNIQALVEPTPGPSHRDFVQPVQMAESDSLISKEKQENELYAKCSKYMRKTYQLRNRLKNLKRKEVLKRLSEEDCIKKLSSKLTPTFALLLQSQIKIHKKKITGRRWTKEEKITALRIFKRSPTCYRLLRRMFHLPAPTTLKSLLNKVPFEVGTNTQIFNVLRDYVRGQKPSDNNYLLMFDEMSLKKHLYYNVKSDIIEGYQDHAGQGRSPLLASYALVFMISGIRKRVKQPIAHYFSSGFSTADRLVVLIKEVLNQCFQAGINIAAIVCDMDGVNRRALNILGATFQNPCITVHGKDIITMFDTPHLLKCFRNLFLKYNIECTANISTIENIIGKGIAKWSHVKTFYEIDSLNENFVYAPALRKEHLDPNTKQKMKVKLAAQVFSHSVAGGMYSKIQRGELPADAIITADLLNDMDKLFDLLNSDQNDLRRGKPHATNLTEKTPHLIFFKKMKSFFESIKFIGCPRKPPSQEGWIWTLNAVERLWNNLKKIYKINSLATRRLQQDPLENLFGCIRGNCGSNTNPTSGQFSAGLKTAILTNLAHMGTTGNCERDNNIIINNLNKLLTLSKKPEPEFQCEYEIHNITFDVETRVNEDSAEMQACTYVCGFLIKKIAMDCDICKNIFLAKEIESYHSFVEWREYSDLKKSLNYVTKNFVNCVEFCATIINTFLEDRSHITNLKSTIKSNLLLSTNFDFLDDCYQHKENNISLIINNVFHICIKRFCTMKNRKFAEEASTSALKRKMNIIMHK